MEVLYHSPGFGQSSRVKTYQNVLQSCQKLMHQLILFYVSIPYIVCFLYYRK
jgi:hypothetical protein